MRVLAFGNQKGGVGKTVSALTIAAILAERGQRVLLVDMDPQASMTSWLGIEAEDRSMAEVLGGAKPGRMQLRKIIKPISKRLWLAPAHQKLSDCEQGLVSRPGREGVLKKAMVTLKGYDLVVIDTPPSQGILTINALTAANGVISPVFPSADDLLGLRSFMDIIVNVREWLNPTLAFVGIVIVQFNGRVNAHHQVLEMLYSTGYPLLLPPVPSSGIVQESASAGQLLTIYDPQDEAAVAYREITNAVEKWLKSLT